MRQQRVSLVSHPEPYAQIGSLKAPNAGQSRNVHRVYTDTFGKFTRAHEHVDAYERALESLSSVEGDQLRAQILKNLGSSHEKLGNGPKAAELWREALNFSPYLAEAHAALGHYALQHGDYDGALEHFDQVAFVEGGFGGRSSVSAWRINALFNLGDGKAAFREISMLLAYADDEDWIWPWCAQQVATFGRATYGDATLSLPFWSRYLNAQPDCPQGTRERLLNMLYLRQGDDYRSPDYAAFRQQFDVGIRLVVGAPAAYLWDRLGHWAQDESNWEEAERCFRHAYDLAGGEYGYCLGTALNFLERPLEALPILIEQAEELQPDDMSWAQVASSYVALGRRPEAIDAYRRAVALNSENASAWFNLGGAYWNAGSKAEALEVWKTALAKFPDHELADRLLSFDAFS